MAEETNDQTPAQDQQSLDPYAFLAKFPNAPSREQIELWKQQAPGGRIRLKASSDLKRVYIMRAIGATELVQVQARLPQNIAPDRVPQELNSLISCHCCLWTSASPDGKLTDMVLRASGAGLSVTLNEVVSILSDYENPEMIERLSVDL